MGDERAADYRSYREQRFRPAAPLVDTPRARETDPDTSHQAAAAIKASGALTEQQRDALQVVRLFPDRTTAELAKLKVEELGAEGAWENWRHIFGRRLSELNGVHIDAGAKRRCTVTGMRARTWRAR